MKLKIRQTIKLFLYILITTNHFSQAHNFLNGGCDNHCEKSFLKKNFEEKIEKVNSNGQIKDNYSCLKKSLCRG